MKYIGPDNETRLH